MVSSRHCRGQTQACWHTQMAVHDFTAFVKYILHDIGKGRRPDEAVDLCSLGPSLM